MFYGDKEESLLCIKCEAKKKYECLWSVYNPREAETPNLCFLLSFKYLFLLISDFHLPCLPISLSDTPLLITDEAPPDLKECKL